MEVWNVIVKSNAFNFLLFVVIITFVLKKIDISAMIKALQDKIVQLIEASNRAKEDSIAKLTDAQSAVAGLEGEISSRIDSAKNTATSLSEKILADAKAQVLNIEENNKKLIDAEAKKIISELSQKTSKASYEVAKKQILAELAKTPQLHDKFINESIESLDGLNF